MKLFSNSCVQQKKCRQIYLIIASVQVEYKLIEVKAIKY